MLYVCFSTHKEDILVITIAIYFGAYWKLYSNKGNLKPTSGKYCVKKIEAIKNSLKLVTGKFLLP